MNELTPLFPLIACDVPTVYSNKQSYYECLCYIGYKLNEAIEAINTFSDDYKNYTDSKVNSLKEYVDQRIGSMKSYIDSIDERINDRIDLEVSELDEKITALEKSVYKQISEIVNLLYQLNDEMKDYVDELIEEVYAFVKSYIPSHIIVMNPTRGYETSLDEALADMWDDLRYYGLTCNEFDSLHLTCNAFENYYLSAHDFDLYGKKRLVKDPELYMFNPNTGEYEFYQDVIYYIVERYHRSTGATATQHDDATKLSYNSATFAFNVTNFDKSNYTCLNIDAYGTNYFIA